MTFSTCMIAIAAFLSGAVAAVFVIGIRKGDRAQHLFGAPDTPLDALTRSVLGIGVRYDFPADRSNCEEN